MSTIGLSARICKRSFAIESAVATGFSEVAAGVVGFSSSRTSFRMSENTLNVSPIEPSGVGGAAGGSSLGSKAAQRSLRGSFIQTVCGIFGGYFGL